MGQGDILHVLRDNTGEWLDTNQILEALKERGLSNQGSMSDSLKRLRKYPPEAFEWKQNGGRKFYYRFRVVPGAGLDLAREQFLGGRGR